MVKPFVNLWLHLMLRTELNSVKKFARKISKECIKRIMINEKMTLEQILTIDSAFYIKSSESLDGKFYNKK